MTLLLQQNIECPEMCKFDALSSSQVASDRVKVKPLLK